MPEPLDADQIEELRRAYRILGVPPLASSAVIRRAYHRLTKRWHPDLYPNASPAQAEANQMMKMINEAYARVQHAPLKDHVDYTADRRPGETAAPAYSRENWPIVAWPGSGWDDFPLGDRYDYWVRFTFGALYGIFISLVLVLWWYNRHRILLVLVSIALTSACGFGSARYGDRFWKIVLSWAGQWGSWGTFRWRRRR